jgi:hypothetical protein
VGSYTEEWLDAWAERVIREVDSSELISEGMVKSPVLGPITIREISSGAKALITMNADDSVISNANSCGDNCAALLAELSRKKDFAVYLAYPMNFEGVEFEEYGAVRDPKGGAGRVREQYDVPDLCQGGVGVSGR